MVPSLPSHILAQRAMVFPDFRHHAEAVPRRSRRWWRRRRVDRVKVEVAERYGVDQERLFVYEKRGKLRVKIKPAQTLFPFAR